MRFLGLHAIYMYGNNFTFVAIMNVFPPGIQLNERYDLKGSWVHRNASLCASGKLATCRRCHEPFIDGSCEKCDVVVGEHEPSMTLKDNDLICKIRLYPPHAHEVISTLYRDSNALCDVGLTDYSLLVGVQHARYDVDMLCRDYRQAADGHGSSSSDHLTAFDDDQRLGCAHNRRACFAQSYPARIVIAPQDYYFGVVDILQTWSWAKKLEM